ncbi:MAG: tetratricopeptide repeat protein [Polyangiaceae bacterium]
MADSENASAHEDSTQFDENSAVRGLEPPPPLRPATLGAWGLAHLTGTWAQDGRPRLVGREFERFRLLHALDRALRDRAPAIVTLSAPAGMGKTRLIDDALSLARVSGFEGRIFCVAALPGDESNALLARMLRARLGIEFLDDPAEQSAMLLQRVGEVLHDARVQEMCVFLGRLLGIPFDDTPLSRALSHDPFHAELAVESLLCELFVADARQAPLVFAIEDLQYVDADSMAVLMALFDKIEGPFVAVCSARPEFFARYEHFTELERVAHEHLELLPLERSEARVLMAQMVGPDACNDAELQRYLFEGGLGNPGLMLQLTREVWTAGALETGADGEVRAFHAERLSSTEELEERSQATETRLFALPHDQRLLLEAAAVVGSACWRGLWSTLVRAARPRFRHFESSELDEVLSLLVRAGHLLVLPDSRIAGETEYVFKRPLERELLLAELPSGRARVFHRAAANWLAEQREASQSSELAALLARHLESCGSTYCAALRYLDAGEAARREGSGVQAAAHLSQGLEVLGDLDNRRRIDALHSLGAVLTELGRPRAARDAFEAMLELAEQLGLAAKTGAALNRLGRAYRDGGELERARQCFERALSAFQAAKDARGVAATEDDLGKLLWLAGDSESALPLLRSGLEGRKSIGDRRSIAVSLSNLALAWEGQGSYVVAEEALGIAHQLFRLEQDLRGCSDALLALGKVAAHRYDLRCAELYFQRAIELASGALDRARLARGLIQLGETKLREGDLQSAGPLLERASRIAEAVESRLDLAEAKRALAKLELKKSHLHDARRHIRASLHMARRSRSRSQLAATMRTLAEIAAAGAWGPSAEARAVKYYMLGIELAKQTDNQLELAKGYRSLARYAERFSQPEIQEQTALLRNLSGQIFARYDAPHV